jgi:hypothetical protein
MGETEWHSDEDDEKNKMILGMRGKIPSIHLDHTNNYETIVLRHEFISSNEIYPSTFSNHQIRTINVSYPYLKLRIV